MTEPRLFRFRLVTEFSGVPAYTPFLLLKVGVGDIESLGPHTGKQVEQAQRLADRFACVGRPLPVHDRPLPPPPWLLVAFPVLEPFRKVTGRRTGS